VVDKVLLPTYPKGRSLRSFLFITQYGFSGTAVKTIGILAKPNFPGVAATLQYLVPWLKERQKEPLLDPLIASFSVDEHTLNLESGLVDQGDMLLVFGGDGTMLRAARLVARHPIPILGINVGGLGFLTEITPDYVCLALENVFRGDFRVEERLMLHSRVCSRIEAVVDAVALNDVVFSKGTLAGMVKLEISIGGEFLTAIRGDGLIISTPTGSTGYSLSSGGPIVNPSVHAMILTPISPHMLTNRPIVVPQTEVVQVVLCSKDEGAVASFDGQSGHPLYEGDTVVVQALDTRAQFIRFPDKTFYQVLRQKLKWGES
tara:strand:- start:189 stop:1139 length:951 start_codon:yes stop_codon:yes gene_type:complete